MTFKLKLPCGRTALLDYGDAHLLLGRRWFADVRRRKRKIYVRGYLPGQRVNPAYLHRLIHPDAEIVDHREHDGLDNRRQNLRPCTISENARNIRLRAGHNSYLGVSQIKSGKWQGTVQLDGCRYYTKTFDTAEGAARARDSLARELHGEFVSLNFPDNEGGGDD